MVIDLRPLLRGETDRIDIDYRLEPQSVDGVSFDSDAQIKGYVTDKAGYMRLVLEAVLPYKGECARCLSPVSGVFKTVFERTVCEERPTDEVDDVYVDEYAVIENGMLDIDREICEEILLGFPSRLLCSEDCPGLCPICGKKLSEGACGCEKKNVDPRLAVLKTLLEKSDGEDN